MRLHSVAFWIALPLLFAGTAGAASLNGVRSPAQSGLLHYEAGVADSVWRSSGTPLECSLSHNIPHFGSAEFSAVAGEPNNLLFELEMKRLPREAGIAQVLSLPSEWQAGQGARSLGRMDLLRHLDSDLGQQQAWPLIDELERGMRPTFMFDGNYRGVDQVAVSLSPVSFFNQYQRFLDCREQLLPYTFEDIAYSVLTYAQGDGELTRESRERLEMIAVYLQYDPVIDLILLDGYSDGYGSRDDNDQRAQQRVDGIRSMLLDQGIEEERITVEAHGERRHIASNSTAAGRQLNRRVVIQMFK